jgi:glycerol-1-phosphate dehydrogenase [NAD(P)+]
VASCGCGLDHRVETRAIHIAPGILAGLANLIPRARRGSVLLLADPDTFEAAGSLSATVLRRGGWKVREAILRKRPHADDRTIDELRAKLDFEPSRIVAVGSGTIGDLGKALAAETGVPLATVGTAASMNGYTSAIAALTVAGLKVTIPAPAPDVLVLDTEVLAGAPNRLTRAGFGDLCSKPVSGADWVVSHRIRGDPLCRAALSLADEAVKSARASATGIGRGDPEAVSELAEALVVSGLSMAMVGSSSPASGGEHLISHYLDISADGWRREPWLHGEQVAVGTRASLALYRRLAKVPAPDGNHGEALPEETPEELASLHGHLSPKALESVLAEAHAKANSPPNRSDRRRRLARDWEELWSDLREQLALAEGLEEDLVAACVPSTFVSIEVDRARAGKVLSVARHMRNRYTVLDMVADMGYLKEWAFDVATELAGNTG